MARKAESTSPFKDINLGVPIDKDGIRKGVSEESCLGKEWDMSSKECPVCAMNDICGILYQDVVNQKVKALEKEKGPFLDQANFDGIDKEALYKECCFESGAMTVDTLAARIMELAKSKDEVAVVEWLKKFKAEKNLKFRGGLVWKE